MRTSVVVELDGRQMAYLERLSSQIRGATGAHLAPPAMIRALVDALSEAAAVSPSTIRSEEDLKALFYRRFTRQDDPRYDRDRMRG